MHEEATGPHGSLHMPSDVSSLPTTVIEALAEHITILEVKELPLALGVYEYTDPSATDASIAVLVEERIGVPVSAQNIKMMGAAKFGRRMKPPREVAQKPPQEVLPPAVPPDDGLLVRVDDLHAHLSAVLVRVSVLEGKVTNLATTAANQAGVFSDAVRHAGRLERRFGEMIEIIAAEAQPASNLERWARQLSEGNQAMMQRKHKGA